MEVADLQQYIKDPLSGADLRTIQNECEDLIELGDPEECKELANYVGGILQEYAPQLQSQPQLYDLYQTYWHRLAFKAFMVLPANVKSDLLQRRLLYAISKGFEPDALIQKYFEALEDFQDVRRVLGVFLKPLDENTETLGSNPVTIEEKKYLPQLKNWILDYSKFPSLNARRGSIDRLNYVNQNQNVRGLTQAQRQTLLKVLKFYDDLLNPEPQIGSIAPTRQFPQAPQAPAQQARSAASAPASQSQVAATAPVQAQPASSATRIDINQKLEDLKHRNQ